jgi:hypothetical protein
MMHNGVKLSPGVTGILPGWDWYKQHEADYPNGIAVSFEIIRPGSHYAITTKTDAVLKESIKEVVR